ncbi:MAG: extracellular solute-binding protein [Deltaproteobacteria bacterium]|nr:extracellular solute-binding protein [Deltaproteobacteria bacterium]
MAIKTLPILLVCLSLSFVGSTIQADTEAVIAKATSFSGKAREAYLVENAKREGAVHLVTTLRNEEVNHLLNRFMVRYPFIQATALRGISGRNLARLEGEFLAKRITFDLWHTKATFYDWARRRGMIVPYFSPELPTYPERFTRKQDGFVGLMISVGIVGYNRRLIKDAEAPRSYEELLDPKWKAKISMDPAGDKTIMALIVAWGKERASTYFRQLLRQDIQFRRGHALLAQLLCAGEYHITFELNAHSAADLIHKGCPIRLLSLSPIAAEPGGLAVLKGAPHPHASILFYDWMLSKEGLLELAKVGRIPTRPDVKPLYPELEKLQTSTQLSMLMTENAPQMEEAHRIVQDVIMKPVAR